MANPFFSGRIPQELLYHVEKYRESTGETKTDVLVQALATYTEFQLDEKNRSNPSKSIVSQLVKRIERLEAEVFDHKKLQAIARSEDYPLLDEIRKAEESKRLKSSTNSKTQVLTTAETIATVGVSQGALSRWKTEGLLPKEFKGYLIDFSHSEKKPRNSFWKVTSI